VSALLGNDVLSLPEYDTLVALPCGLFAHVPLPHRFSMTTVVQRVRGINVSAFPFAGRVWGDRVETTVPEPRLWDPPAS
jgi:hypothetical protein